MSLPDRENSDNCNGNISFQEASLLFSKSLANPDPGEEVVISGLAGHYPESDGVYEFRDNLMNKVDMVSGDTRRWEPNVPDVPQRTGKMKHIEKLDAGFFGIHHRQAHAMDPMVRGFLERSIECILDAGLHPSDLEGTKCGVFVGSCFSETERKWFFNTLTSQTYAITGIERSMIANRISYYLKLNGPSYTTDSACSSSLYALEHAYRAIRSGECDSAIVGGTNVCLHPFVSLQFFRLGVLSSDGSCKAFDKSSNGYARSETICAIFLQKSKVANRIYAQVVHAKTNCDGYKEQGITYPSGEAQKELLEDFYKECRFKPNDISYLETHGTGTVVGDPEEATAIDAAFSKCRDKPLLIGSVKTNIGHTEPASGMVSVTKAIIAYETGFIPPSLHYKTPREGLKPLEEGRLKVVTEKTPFEDERALIGINSFGFGGGNCHVVLQRYQKEKLSEGIPNDDIPRLVCVSGRKPESVTMLLDEVNKGALDAEYIKLIHNVFRKDIAGHNYRGYSIKSKTGEIKRSHAYFTGEKEPLFFVLPEYDNTWHTVGKYLLSFPIFSATIDRIHNILSSKNINLSEIILCNYNEKAIVENLIGNVAVCIGILEILKLLEIKPDNLLGSSFGEIVCAFYREILTLEEAIGITYELAMFVQDKFQTISTFIVEINYENFKKYLPKDLKVIPYNRSACLVSGNIKSINCFIKDAKTKGIRVTELIDQGYRFNPYYNAKEKMNILNTLNKIIGKPRLITNWLSESYLPEEFITAQYFLNSLERCSNSCLSLVEKIPNEATIFELGNGKICKISEERIKEGKNFKCIFLENNYNSDINQFLDCLGRLYNYGYNPQIYNLYPEVQLPVSRGTPMISPHIKWNHDAEWFVTKYKNEIKLKTGVQVFNINVVDSNWKFVLGHVVDGRNLFPATGYLYLVWESLAHTCGYDITEINVAFEHVKFLRATTLPTDGKVMTLTVMIQRGSGNFEVIESNTAIVTGKAYINKNRPDDKIKLPTTVNISDEDVSLKTKDVYKELRLRGYNYKGLFRGVVESDVTAEKGLVRWDNNWISFMDNMLQMKILQLDSRHLYVPTYIEKLTIDGKKHLSYIKEFVDNPLLPVFNNKHSGLIKCGGIEVTGLQASSIPRRKSHSYPVLEKYVFIPNETNLSLPQSVRVLIQLALEMNYTIKVKAVEVIDEATFTDSEPLSPLVYNALSDQPLIQSNIIVFTKDIFEDKNLTVENRNLVTESDCLIVIGTNLLGRPQILQNAFEVLKENGFILSRESLNFDLNTAKLEEIDIISIHITESEKLILFRKSIKLQIPTLINIENNNFEWIPELQELTKNDSSVIVYSQSCELSGIIGFTNCIRREPGGNGVVCFLVLDPKAPKFNLNDDLYRRQWEKNMTINVYKDGCWGTYRHLLLEDDGNIKSEHCYVNVTVRGDLSSLKYIQGPLTSKSVLQPDNTLVSVYYAAINFRDLMTASGRINSDVITMDRSEQECIQGFEYAGRMMDGRRVTGMVSNKGITTLLEADSVLMVDIPDSWTMEEAATITVVYTTVLYSFLVRGRMKRGESVLIHSGTGGVGQAAIQVALFYGCKVFTTVGTPEKVEYIKKRFPQLTDNNISNSHDTSFEEFIKQQTNGRGVDLVLNSLAEEKLIASVRCLAKGGRFLEIGKFDLGRNNNINLLLLEKEASFHGIMLDSLFKSDKQNKSIIKKLLKDGLKNGCIQPLERTVFKEDELEKAFRYMATGKHTGKVLINIKKEEQIKYIPPTIKEKSGLARYYCNPEKTYIICGGLGGFGLELADWLILRGARKVVLTTRSGVKTGYQAMRIRIWKSYKATILISKDNILTEEGCKELLNRANKLGPVEAIFNLAVVLKDATFENQNAENFKQSFEPKATATKFLDELSRVMCPNLKKFVIFSSVSCGRGNAGQTNYGMANSIMERICEQRQKDGYPATAIEWGAIGEVGLVAEMQEEQFDLEISGTLQQRIANCLSVMDTFLNQNNAVVSSMVVAEKHSGLGGASLVDVCANILGIRDLKTVSLHATLAELGMDSMTAVEIKQTLEREFEVFLNAQDVRSLTFARLHEIQLEKETKEFGTTAPKEKVLRGIEMLVSFMGSESDSNIPMMRLKTKVDENSIAPNIFLFPGIEGTFKTLIPLAKNLNAHALTMQFVYDKPNSSLFEIANAIVPYIIENMIHDKFTIVAYSFGSVIALEAISILELNGYSGKVILIDGSPELMSEFARTQLQLESDDLLQTSIICALMANFVPLNTISKNKDKILNCANLEERVKVTQEILPNDIPYSQEYQKTMIIETCNRIKALVSYKPSFSKIKSKVTLCKPKNLSVTNLPKDYKLSELCQQPVDILEFDGNHISILENIKLAETINNFVSSSNVDSKINHVDLEVVHKKSLIEGFESFKEISIEKNI